MSNNSHHEKYFGKMILGFGSILASVFVIFYSIFELNKESDWYFWAILAAFLLCSGIYFSLTAFVHKVKSDFNKRAKQREMQKSTNVDRF